jgi:hypothetical protein
MLYLCVSYDSQNKQPTISLNNINQLITVIETCCFLWGVDWILKYCLDELRLQRVSLCDAYLWRRHYTESVHNSVRVFLSYLGYEQCPHSRTCAPSQRVSQLEPLQAVAALCLFAENIHHSVHQLCSLSIMAFCPVVPCRRNTKLSSNTMLSG